MANLPTWDPMKVKISTDGIVEASDIDADGRCFVAIDVVGGSAALTASRSVVVTVPTDIPIGSSLHVALDAPITHPLPWGGQMAWDGTDARFDRLVGLDYLGRDMSQSSYAVNNQTKVITHALICANQGAVIVAGTQITCAYHFTLNACMPYAVKDFVRYSYTLPRTTSEAEVVVFSSWGVSDRNLGVLQMSLPSGQTAFGTGTIYAEFIVDKSYGIYGNPI